MRVCADCGKVAQPFTERCAKCGGPLVRGANDVREGLERVERDPGLALSDLAVRFELGTDRWTQGPRLAASSAAGVVTGVALSLFVGPAGMLGGAAIAIAMHNFHSPRIVLDANARQLTVSSGASELYSVPIERATVGSKRRDDGRGELRIGRKGWDPRVFAPYARVPTERFAALLRETLELRVDEAALPAWLDADAGRYVPDTRAEGDRAAAERSPGRHHSTAYSDALLGAALALRAPPRLRITALAALLVSDPSQRTTVDLHLAVRRAHPTLATALGRVLDAQTEAQLDDAVREGVGRLGR